MKKWILFSLLLLSPMGATRLQADAPQEVAALLQKAESVLGALDPSRLAPFTEGDAKGVYKWMRYTSAKDWRVAPLIIPASAGRDAEEYAVFHRFNSCESAGDHLHKIARRGDRVLIGEEIPETETLGFKITHHDMRLSANMTQKSVRIENRFTLERESANESPYVAARLLADLQIQSLADSNGKPIPFWRSASLLVFPAPKEAKSFITATYSGTVSHSGSDYIMENEMTLNSYWQPVIGRNPATLKLTAIVPKGFAAITHGEITEEKANADGGKTVTFVNKIPICYFTFDMGKYRVTHVKKNGIDLYAYLMSEHPAESVQAYLERADACIQWFGKNFSPYPYTRYTLVETLGNFGGALEGYSFATFARGTLGATVHEIAHTWWGGIVPCTYLNSMWNESFANYSDDLYERIKGKMSPPSAEQLLAARKQFAKMYGAIPVLSPGNTEFGPSNGVGYGKGAQVLRALEEEIGREAMLKVAQSFIQSHRKGAAAEWADIEASVRRVTGKDYRWFFEQWLERTGVPQLQIADVKTETIEGKTVVSGFIVQKGTPYRLKTPITLYGAKGAQEQVVTITGELAEFRFETNEPVKLIRIDPKGALLLGAPEAEKDDPYAYRFPAGKREEI